MTSALENVYEAIVGALYLDGGFACRRRSSSRGRCARTTPRPTPCIPLAPSRACRTFAQRELRCAPEYKLVGEEGPAHSPTFTSVVLLEGRRVGRGSGSSKKEAESEAALDALQRMGWADDDATAPEATA